MSKILIELVPKYCQFSNIRSTVTTKQWDKLRRISYEKADNRCEICFEKGKDQGFRHDVECHEIWLYDDKRKIQFLVALISLCPLCHMIKHIGRASAIGKQGECFAHMEKVNKWTHKQIVEHMAESYLIQKQRSKIKYKLNLDALNSEPYNLDFTPPTDRVYEKSKYCKVKTKKTKRVIKR